MKILAGSDFHGNPKVAEALAEKAVQENVDLVVICGDITDSDKVKGRVIKPFLDAKKKVLFIPGNHDSPATAQFISDFYDVMNLHDNVFIQDDIGIFGCSAINCGLHQVSEKETLQTLARGFEKIKGLRKKVMVTHTHPSNSSIAAFTNFVAGSDAVRKAIEYFKPDIHLCGHVHEADGVEERVGTTRVINVGPRGKIIEL